jgi:CRP-like cAMP-binding protein
VAGKKSGIRTFKPGEVMFRQGDPANSLYIIQKGQLRLFIPKGRGFVELAILRSGEVIGEMAYFDQKTSRRSCSAEAMVTTDVIEISFKAFAKTMEGLNPWFKTIINTLADRLRKTNDKVKALESNSLSVSKDGAVPDYVFFHTSDILRMLSTLFLVINAHGEKNESFWEIHLNKLNFYLYDIYNVPEVKFEEFRNLLVKEKYIEMGMDENNLPKVVKIDRIDQLRSIILFLNTQKMTEDSKKLRISSKCERFLKKILDQLVLRSAKEDTEIANISAILKDFKEKSVPIEDSDLKDAIDAKLCDDIIVGNDGELTTEVNYAKLKKVFPSIRMVNAIKRANDEKAGTA